MGAGKPKAFLTLMTSGSKKQPAKRSPGTSRAKGQGNKSKSSASAAAASVSTPAKKGESHVASRTSNRSIKRPRTYDEDLDELKAVKASSSSKRAKGNPKVSEYACSVPGGSDGLKRC